MASLSSPFTLLDQCCDGETYLRLGEACALTGDCYDAQRPMGAVYWFSLPYRLGLDANALVYAHLLLAAISILLSTLTIGKQLIHHTRLPKQYLIWAAIAMTSTLIHFIFLYPLLRVSLSDIPAGLLALNGIWILLLCDDEDKYGWIKIAVAGLCIGMAAWVRAFYLYPLLASISVWTIICWKQKSFKNSDGWLFLAALPILIQYGVTYQQSGSFSFISPEKIDEGIHLHLDDPAIGYDMIIRPREFWRWQSDCGEINGLVTSIKNADATSLLCLIKGRINFYFGSYSHITYHNFYNAQIYWGDSPLPEPLPPFELRELESSIENAKSDKIRNWSPIYLSFNIFAICGAVVFALLNRKHIHGTHTLILLFIVFIIAESLLIIPEQRFIIVPLIIIWLTCLRVLAAVIMKSNHNGSI